MRIRTLIRKHKWVGVTVDKEVIEDSNGLYGRYASWEKNNKHNADIYKDMVEWCNATVGSGNFASSLHSGTAYHNNKQFAFKQAKHATLFKLRWL